MNSSFPISTGFSTTPIYNFTEVKNGPLKPNKTLLTRPNTEYLLGRGHIKPEEFIKYIKHANQTIDSDYLSGIIQKYFEYGQKLGINTDAAISQAILETGNFSFKGDVKREQNNFAGLGAIGGGIRGERFATPEDGVIAHLLHLYIYCGFQPPDELKNKMGIRTKALIEANSSTIQSPRARDRRIQDLTGTWAADKQYGGKIVNVILSVKQFSEE